MERNPVRARLPLLRTRLLSVAPWVVLCLAMQGALGCSATEQWEWQWQYFTVEKEHLEEERETLAEVIHEVLVHRRYYPESDRGLAESGKDAVLVTDWNEEDAMIQQGSFTGTRTRVAIRLTEGIERSEPLNPQNPADQSLIDLERWDDPREEHTVLSLGIASERELNTRMNYIPGEHRKAEWRSHGSDPEIMKILLDQIDNRFREVSRRDHPEPGDMSERTRQIYEQRHQRGEEGQDETPYGAIGPGSNRGGSGLSFGTDRASQ